MSWRDRFVTGLVPAAPPERLATFRILVAGFMTGYLTVRMPVFLRLADQPAHRFEPIGVVGVLNQPLPAWLWYTIYFGTLVVGVAACVGFRYRISGPLFAVGVLAVLSYRSSWGQILWFEHLMALHALVVGLSPAAHALSIDTRPRPPDQPESIIHQAHRAHRAHQRYGWPVRLAAVITVITYAIAGIAKLRIGGLDWIFSGSLRNHIAFSAARTEVLGGFSSPLVGPLMAIPWAFPPLALVSLILELGAPLALAGGRWRRWWVIGTWSMHIVIAASMLVVFPYSVYGIAFTPLYNLENMSPALRRWRSSIKTG